MTTEAIRLDEAAKDRLEALIRAEASMLHNKMLEKIEEHWLAAEKEVTEEHCSAEDDQRLKELGAQIEKLQREWEDLYGRTENLSEECDELEDLRTAVRTIYFICRNVGAEIKPASVALQEIAGIVGPIVEAAEGD